MNGQADGAYTFQVRAKITSTTTGGDTKYYSDLGTITTTPAASYTWTRDTVVPTLVFTSTPTAKSQYFVEETTNDICENEYVWDGCFESINNVIEIGNCVLS